MSNLKLRAVIDFVIVRLGACSHIEFISSGHSTFPITIMSYLNMYNVHMYTYKTYDCFESIIPTRKGKF